MVYCYNINETELTETELFNQSPTINKAALVAELLIGLIDFGFIRFHLFHQTGSLASFIQA